METELKELWEKTLNIIKGKDMIRKYAACVA